MNFPSFFDEVVDGSRDGGGKSIGSSCFNQSGSKVYVPAITATKSKLEMTFALSNNGGDDDDDDAFIFDLEKVS